MKLSHSDSVSVPLEQLAATAVRLGRELQQMAHAVYLGGNTLDAGFVSRTLRRLADRDAFDPRDDASFEALRGILEKDLRSELVKTERHFVETHYDAEGQHGEVVERPVYSERGQEILRIQETLIRFTKARAATLDQIAAERAISRLLRA